MKKKRIMGKTAAKPIRKPVARRRVLKPGPQSRPGPALRAFAARFPGKPSAELVRHMAKAMLTNLKVVKVKGKQFSESYSRRTAEQILSSGKVFALKGKLSGVQSIGCLDFTIAMTAALRARGIPASFVRIGTHSYSVVKLGGERFIVDLTHKAELVWKLSETESRLIQIKKKKKEFAIGKDAWSVGIRGIRDFERTF